jgi:hypothetical protein
MNFDEVMQLQVLKHKALSMASTTFLIDKLIEQNEIELRQMCAKVSPELYAALEEVTELLDMSKREFIEAAAVLARAEEAIERSGNALDQDEPEVMLTLTGTIRAVTTWAVVLTRRPARSHPDSPCAPDRGAWTTVVWFNCSPSPCQTPSLLKGKVGEQVTVPVRAWAPGAP